MPSWEFKCWLNVWKTLTQSASLLPWCLLGSVLVMASQSSGSSPLSQSTKSSSSGTVGTALGPLVFSFLSRPKTVCVCVSVHGAQSTSANRRTVYSRIVWIVCFSSNDIMISKSSWTKSCHLGVVVIGRTFCWLYNHPFSLLPSTTTDVKVQMLWDLLP